MASPELGLSLTFPHTDVAYKRSLTIEDNGTQIKVPLSGKPSMPAAGAYFEGRYPFLTTDNKAFTLHATAGGGYAWSPSYTTASWGLTGGVTYNLPNTFLRLMANAGYGGWSVATPDNSGLNHGALVGVGITGKFWRLFDVSAQAAWRTDFNNSQSMIMLGASYYLGERPIPPIDTRTTIMAHMIVKTAQETVDRMMSYGDNLLERIQKYVGAEIDLEIQALGYYFLWLRSPDKEDRKELDLPTINVDIELVNHSLSTLSNLSQGMMPEISNRTLEIRRKHSALFHKLAQDGLNVLFMADNSLFQQVLALGYKVKSNIDSNALEAARKNLDQYQESLELIRAIITPRATPDGPPALEERFSAEQKDQTQRFRDRLKCVITAEGCSSFVDIDPKITIPALRKTLESLGNGKTKVAR